jgi:hypothetical protein
MRPGRGRKRGGRESQVLRPMMTGQPMVVLLEVCQVFRQMPGQGIFLANDAVAGAGKNQVQLHG